MQMNSLTGSIPTELGMATAASILVLHENKLSSRIPTELGKCTGVTKYFKLDSNRLCSDVPTQVQALSSGVTNWFVTTRNSIGTTCGWLKDTRFLGAGPTSATSINYASQVRQGV